jgi:hypothetical protein
MPTSRNGGPLPSCRRDNLDLPGAINRIAVASCSVYLATRSVVIAIIVVAAAALLVIAGLTRQR